MSVVRPGSHCPGCGKPLGAFDNVPILSWLLLRGRRPAAAAPASPRATWSSRRSAGSSASPSTRSLIRPLPGDTSLVHAGLDLPRRLRRSRWRSWRPRSSTPSTCTCPTPSPSAARSSASPPRASATSAGRTCSSARRSASSACGCPSSSATRRCAVGRAWAWATPSSHAGGRAGSAGRASPSPSSRGALQATVAAGIVAARARQDRGAGERVAPDREEIQRAAAEGDEEAKKALEEDPLAVDARRGPHGREAAVRTVPLPGHPRVDAGWRDIGARWLP